jgi:putative membrane protein
MMYGSGFGLIELLIVLIILGVFAGVILLVVWAVRRISASGDQTAFSRGGEVQPSAREILQMRYARGEITREQYLEMLADLS